ncbi:hypothetical protein NliqN6_5470 [Naganishia liquefaciens]|uniref:Peptidase M20 dimerisation domain-containing protein n=1 Tax=Naganishia liquefaciens TaxID=104408 RepID=A0A8H3TXU6_9TREE|nr:hypothetical protein NliqN6_5470 [Naganishia liquefaciens]
MPSLSEKNPEYQVLPTTECAEPVVRPARKSWFSFSKSQWLLVLIALYAIGLMGFDAYSRTETAMEKPVKSLCPSQPKALGKGPGWHVAENYTDIVTGRLSRAVQIAAVSYDDMGPVGEDDRWKPHFKFEEFLKSEYPRVYETLDHEMVNTHGHLFTWAGTNKALQPIILMAHEDVVPVLPATLDKWTYPPFEGKVDDKWVWGRGAADCKNQLMGIMNAVEKLVIEGFKPERTILLSFGFDEEIGGYQGASYLADTITSRYGPESIAFLVDEGFGGVDQAYGATFASLGMAEKGRADLKITVETPGGHSSVPPEHTSIGILSRLLVELEANPFEPSLTAESPYLKYLTCLADHAPDVPKAFKRSVAHPGKWKALAKRLAGESAQNRAFLATTQAIDLISGGVKVNALPEVATATINHRIAFTSSIEETKQHASRLLGPLAHKLGFDYIAFNETASGLVAGTTNGKRVTLDVVRGAKGTAGLEPAPITPSDSESFELIGSTIKQVFGDDVVVAPSAMFANTDTRAYWNLTRNLYRFAPTSINDFRNPHTVDEAMSIKGHLTTIEFFYQLLQNTAGWKQEQEQ